MGVPMGISPIDFLGNMIQNIIEGDEGETDLLEVLEKIRPLLNDRQWKELCMQFDICPFHTQDIEICLDDDDDCLYLLELEFPDHDFEGK